MRTSEMKKHGFGRVLLRILGTLLAMLLIAVAVFLIIPLTERVDKTPVAGSADWMSALDDGVKLNELVLPGTHDSATQYVDLAFFSKCQALSVGEQLEAGARYLDIRLGVDEHNGIFKLMHGFTNCRPSAVSIDALYLDELLRECYAFLAAHPSEAVLFAVKQEHGEESVEEFETMLDGYLRENPDYWLLTDTLPTLGEARGKLVLLRRYEDAAGLGERAGVPFLWEDQRGHENVALNTEGVEQGTYRLWVQDRFEYSLEDKWSAFEKGMADAGAQKGEGDIILSFLSTKGTASYGHPWKYAKDLNARLLKTNDLTGWIVLDFLDARLASHLYSMNFN